MPKKGFSLTFFVLLTFICFYGIAFADDGSHYINGQMIPGGERKDNPLRDIGGFFGWVTFALAAGAAGLFAFRRALKKFKNANPEMKDMLKSGAMVLRKYHLAIGFVAVAVAGIHGAFMFFTADKLGLNEWIGIASIGVAVIATIIGSILSIRKKMSVGIRQAHSSVMLVAGILAVVHILIK